MLGREDEFEAASRLIGEPGPGFLGDERMFFSSAESHRISIYFSYILRPPLEGRALHSQECFFPPRGGFNLRCTRERYIPKNVFFLREEVLIYDERWSRFFEQNFRVAKWNLCRG